MRDVDVEQRPFRVSPLDGDENHLQCSDDISPWKENLLALSRRMSGDITDLDTVEKNNDLRLPQVEILLSRQ
jgi:hypothetical protein